MIFSYSPVETPLHGLDARVKLFVQLAAAIATVRITGTIGLLILGGIAIVGLYITGVSILEFLYAIRYVLVLLVMAPIVGAATLGTPWIDPSGAIPPTIASIRVVILLGIGLVYVRTTPIRESQAAIQWAIPGKVGRALALGVRLVFRFVPLIRTEIRSTRRALRARGTRVRPLHERIYLLTIITLTRTLGRTDRITRGLQARCLSWHPTLPPLQCRRWDAPAVLFGVALIVWSALQ